MPSPVMRSFDSHLMSETPVALSGAFLDQVGIDPPRWLPGFRGERKLVGSACVEPGDPHRTLHAVQSCIREKKRRAENVRGFR